MSGHGGHGHSHDGHGHSHGGYGHSNGGHSHSHGGYGHSHGSYSHSHGKSKKKELTEASKASNDMVGVTDKGLRFLEPKGSKGQRF